MSSLSSMSLPYEVRGAVPADEDQLLDVAQYLNTVNLPADREAIRGLLEHAQKSFAGTIKDPRRREYVFVVVDLSRSRIVGASMIIGQLGRRDSPYIYVDVLEEERYSATLDKHFRHVVLKVGYSYNGPTEIGGLIVEPSYRKRPERVGLAISYMRFLFIKMHREWFRDDLLAELLPPLEPDGTSHLWNAFGRKFTDLTYAEADRLSKQNKEFVRGLFPEGPVYATLLPQDAQDVVGRVGEQTKGVERMLRRIGFHYARRVDPFDGGPHFTVATDEVTLIKVSQKTTLTRLLPPGARADTCAMLAVELTEAPFVRAVVAPCKRDKSGAHVSREAATRLGLKPGDPVWVLPIE